MRAVQRTRFNLVASAVVACLALLPGAWAQQPGLPVPAVSLPDSPGQQAADAAVAGSITGSVVDPDLAAIAGAKITLEDVATKVTRTTEADIGGAFAFDGVKPGTYRVLLKSQGFSPWKVESVVVAPQQAVQLVQVVLGVEALDVSVTAITQEDQAEEQISAEVKQRIIGVFPNFYVSYVKHPAPLTNRLKFKLALKVSTDPLTFIIAGVNAGVEQQQGDFAGYGPGFGGYATRYAASYGDGLSRTFLGAAIFPSLFHQDPRYYYKGTGSVTSRALYAISTVVRCHGDNGRWQPNYSNILGNLAAGGLSSLYYPKSDQHSVQVTVTNTLIGTAEGSFSTLLQEFLLRHFTHGAPPPPAP